MTTEDKSLLTDAEIEGELASLPGWRREGIFLKKSFRFADFKEINAFLPHLASSIVRLNHHPDILFLPGEKRLDVATSTHSHQAITRADLALACALESWQTPAV